ncbi:SusC/RagA family TonB-linked outer membrane protein [Bacteroidia bacterium]|nr:SusC/RagA family TonB-linked outer membrane protein [Bacteroidia bacterium]
MSRLFEQLKIRSFYTGLLVWLLLTGGCLAASAQGSSNLSGTVRNSAGEPVAGAQVVEVGVRQRGATTDVRGQFSLPVSSLNASVQVSFIGMETQTVALGGKNNISVTMAESTESIDAVVVTALGITRESKSLGYAVSSVDATSLRAGREDNVMQAIVGKVAGVDISTTSAGPSGSTRVLIRGNSQLTGSNLPLYVVDGMILDNSQLAGAEKWGGYDYGDVLSSINPEDIENISILKGPSASALYGSMASNGVVMITTKKGTKKQPIGIEVSSNVSIVSLLSHFDDYQRVYGMGRNGAIPMSESDGRGMSQVSWGGKLDPNLMVQIYDGRIVPYGNINNNILSFFDTGVTAQNTVTFSSGTEKSTIRASVSDMRNKDIVPKSKLDRTNFTLRGTTKLGKSFNIDASATYSTEGVDNRPGLSDEPSNIGNALIGIAPNFDQRYLRDSYMNVNGTYTDWNSNGYRLNPYWVINQMHNSSRRNRFMGQARITWQLTTDLKLALRGGLDSYTFRATQLIPPSTPYVTEGNMVERDNNVTQSNLEATLTYTKKFGKFDLNAFVGSSLLRNRNETFYLKGIDQKFPGVESINAFDRQSVEHGLYRKEVRSLFASASVGYDGWAYLDATLRNDISSALSKGNRSYMYPSVSGSVIFSELFSHGSWLDLGKVRASWANVGGDTSPYQLMLDFGKKGYSVGGQTLGMVDPTGGTIPNYDIKPTNTYSIELGAEMKFFKSRLGFDLTLYQQSTTNQIMALPISPTSGFSKALINAGEIRNRGVELALTGVPVQKKVEWSTTVTYSRNVNKVISLHPDVPVYSLAQARWAGAEIQAWENQPYGMIVGKKVRRTPDGQMIVNSAGMPTFETENSVLGKGTFDHILGWSNRVSWNRLSLSTLFDAKFGADMFSMSMMQSYYNGTATATLEGRDAWYTSEQNKLAAGSPSSWVPTGGYLAKGVKEGPMVNGEQTYIDNDVYVNPQLYWQTYQEGSPEPFICDASFIKWRELSLSYELPQKWLKKTALAGVTFTAYGRNLLILYSNIKNIDPESSYNNGNGQGFEYGSLPSRRTFGFGVNVKF